MASSILYLKFQHMQQTSKQLSNHQALEAQDETVTLVSRWIKESSQWHWECSMPMGEWISLRWWQPSRNLPGMRHGPWLCGMAAACSGYDVHWRGVSGAGLETFENWHPKQCRTASRCRITAAKNAEQSTLDKTCPENVHLFHLTIR